MKGIYLTTEAKQELEAKIAELDLFIKSNKDMGYYALEQFHEGRKMIYQEILASLTILPVEESWDIVNEKTDYGLSDREVYPNGVIIQPKK
jgi:GH35 family endo-1,4-beta-xylanase